MLISKSPIFFVPTVLRSICMKASLTSKKRSLPTGEELGMPIPFPFNSEKITLSAPVE